MRRLLCLLICVMLCLGLFGCGQGNTTAEPEASTEAETVRDYSEFAGIVADPKTWYEEFMALPIASPDMTEQELRQLCVDAFKMHASFVWTPTEDINYTFTLLERTSVVSLPAGIAYAGMCYCSGGENGNIWKALQFYDHETGAVDIAAMDGQMIGMFTSACARAVEWAYARISNSHGLEGMASFNKHLSNIALVGTYNYANGKYSFSDGPGTLDIIKENGEDVIVESYAAMKMADSVYSSSSFHVMMCSADPVIVYSGDGRVNPDLSYVLVCEQDAVGTKGTTKDSTQSNGVTLRTLGSIDNKYTFRQLLEKGYVPFTVKELTGEDPVETSDAWIGHQAKRIENGTDIDLSTVFSNKLCTNYAICTVELQIKDADGQVLLTVNPHANTLPYTYELPLSVFSVNDEIKALANGTNTAHIYVRLANGELMEAFNTVLKVS